MRILLILGPFFLAIGGLVFLQTGLFAPQADLIQAKAPEPAMQLTSVTDVVARLPEEDQPSLEAALEVALAASTQNTSTETEELQALTSSVLAGLGFQPTAVNTAPTQDEVPDELRTLTNTVLAGLTGMSVNGTTAQQPESDQSLAAIISRAMLEGRSDAYLDALINEVAQTGALEVPEAFVTSDGRVDTNTLMTQLAHAVSGQTASETPAEFLVGSPGVEVRVVQEAGVTVQQSFYTVQNGDSLGAISQLFYGDAALYSKIFEANRHLISSPDRIRAGQRLSIPPFQQI